MRVSRITEKSVVVEKNTKPSWKGAEKSVQESSVVSSVLYGGCEERS
jgi:hypothetical protein